ncbi:tyrosine-type recombinase/integrase [Vibrio barjaei]|uniref:tyrosine-type recombinase/integrase n=1 Tax=Vibrio barjaei TaxID=1676683 RepID=UPI0022845BD8|nr:hypothetical protein [Vibrio barjaei]MCY9871802.1 hypothetical protein [Vibrio barjaei]
MDKEQLTKELLHSIVSQVISKLTPLVSPATSHTFLADENAPIRIKASTDCLLTLSPSWQDAPINHSYVYHHLKQVKTATHKILESHQQGNHSEVLQGVSTLRDMYLPPAPTIPQQPQEHRSPSLEVILPLFTQHLTKKLSGKPLSNKLGYLKPFTSHADLSTPITEIDHNYLEDCWYEMLTTDNKSHSTLKKRKTVLSDLFKFCLREDHITKNPMEYAELPLDGKKTPRTMFPDDIHQSIIQFCKSNLSNPCAWGVLIMSYSGMRNSEVSSCKILSRDNIPYFHIAEGKTDNAARRIPVHQTLIDLGIEEIFPTLTIESYSLTLYYSKVLRPTLNIPRKDTEGSLYNLYSLRHNFVTTLQTLPSASQSYVKVLVGHKDITSNYTHLSTSHLPDLQRIINQLK